MIGAMRTLLAIALTFVLGGAARAADIQVTSPAFAPGAPIPREFSSYADNHSPPLSWTAVPGARSYALILRDPDAPMGTFTHWLVWNIPGDVTAMPQDGLYGVVLGKNDAGSVGYFGPHPPYGRHHYHFQVYALDAALRLPAGAGVGALEAAMRGHVIAQGELIGTFAP